MLAQPRVRLEEEGKVGTDEFRDIGQLNSAILPAVVVYSSKEIQDKYAPPSDLVA